jgi:hypothetical protein
MGLEAGKTPGPLPVQRTGDAAAIAAPDEAIGFYFSKSDNRLTASVNCNQAIKDQVDAGCRKGYHRSKINAAYRIDDGHTQRIGN